METDSKNITLGEQFLTLHEEMIKSKQSANVNDAFLNEILIVTTFFVRIKPLMSLELSLLYFQVVRNPIYF